MPPVNLKKILTKQKLQPLLQNLISGLNTAIAIEAVDGQRLLGVSESASNHRHSILVGEEVVGWVVGEKHADVLADLLSLVAKQEAEKKELARELLERYQEIDLFEDLSTQLTASLETRQIAQLVLQEMSRLIESSAGIILLRQDDGTEFETIAAFGQFFKGDRPALNQSIIGKIVQAGRAELINDVAADPRSTGQIALQALICVPLKAKGRVLGAIAIGASLPDTYMAEHLKLVSIFASQTAVAIDKALLYEQSCHAAVEAKAQAERLQQALQNLQLAQTQLIQSEKMSSLGQLIAGVAHEINNPVNFIAGNLKYVSDYVHDLLRLVEDFQKFVPTVPPELALQMEAIDLDFLIQDLPKILKSMKLGTNRIVEIVQSLKNFSRHDDGEMKQVNIHDGIDGTLMILRHRLKSAGDRPAIEVVKDYAELPAVECYAGQLNQVFMNILANAIDALEEAFVPDPVISIRTQWIEHSVVVRIADNGLGMPEAILRRIYDPFFTTKEIGKGTGLGMAISHQIVVERHRGVLKCRSQPGEGTEFWIQIPVCCGVAEAAQEQDAETVGAIAPSESLLTTDADGFVPSPSPILNPADLLTRHKQLIQRLSQQNTDVNSISTEQIYQLFQHYPITLKLYTVLLSQFCCAIPVYHPR